MFVAVPKIVCVMNIRLLIAAFFIHRFQSEKETGDRNFAIGYYLKEKKVRMFLMFIKILDP